MVLLEIVVSISTILIILWTVYNLLILVIGMGLPTDSEDTHAEGDLPMISLIVPVKNEEVVISRCLESIIDQNYPKNRFEVIIVDGWSSDDTIKICNKFKTEHPNLITILEQKGAKGKPSALNDGLEYANGEIVGVFDSDSVPYNDVLMKVSESFRDEAVTAIQCRTTSINEHQNYLTRIAAKEENIWLRSLSYRDRMGLFVTLTGSCQFVRRKALRKMEGWREDALAEDMELALRLTKNKYMIKYEESAGSLQETPANIGDIFTQRTRWYRGCLENLFRFGSLLRRPTRKSFDAEIVMLGPLLMALSQTAFITSLTQIFFIKNSANPIPLFSVTITPLSLTLLGLSLALIEKPFNLKSLAWIPIMYFYWLLQSIIALWSLLLLLSGRNKSWEKTGKKGTVTSKDEVN